MPNTPILNQGTNYNKKVLCGTFVGNRSKAFLECTNKSVLRLVHENYRGNICPHFLIHVLRFILIRHIKIHVSNSLICLCVSVLTMNIVSAKAMEARLKGHYSKLDNWKQHRDTRTHKGCSSLSLPLFLIICFFSGFKRPMFDH